MFWHNHFGHVTAQNLLPRIAKNAFCCAVELNYFAVNIHNQNGIQRRGNRSFETGPHNLVFFGGLQAFALHLEQNCQPHKKDGDQSNDGNREFRERQGKFCAPV